MRAVWISWLLAGMLGVGEVVAAPSDGNDWRESGSETEKLDNLVKLVPGTAVWMQQIGYRYADLYFAAKQGKWDFAIYQAEELEKLVDLVGRGRPKRAATAEQFQRAVFPSLHEEVARADWPAFEAAFSKLAAECMSCHVKNDHGFITVPVPPGRAFSPVLEP